MSENLYVNCFNFIMIEILNLTFFQNVVVLLPNKLYQQDVC